MAAERAGRGVEVTWNDAELASFEHNPDGEAKPLVDALGRVVTEGAKRRALVRTGQMRSLIYYTVEPDEIGMRVEILSPARNLNPNEDEWPAFNYPIVHERKHPRDRRPHRSLVPALLDLRKITEPG